MGVQVYGCNHFAIEVDGVEKAVAFYQDVFDLEKFDEGEGDAFFKMGAHQFLAIFEVEEIAGANSRPAFGFSAAPISSRRFIALWLSSYPLGVFSRAPYERIIYNLFTNS
jgi:hypothetical protein